MALVSIISIKLLFKYNLISLDKPLNIFDVKISKKLKLKSNAFNSPWLENDHFNLVFFKI